MSFTYLKNMGSYENVRSDVTLTAEVPNGTTFATAREELALELSKAVIRNKSLVDKLAEKLLPSAEEFDPTVIK